MRLARPAAGQAETLPQILIEPGGRVLDWQELWRFRDLFGIFALRDIKLRYRQTALGIVWVILQPLAAALIFAVIFGVLAHLPSNGTPYLLFVFAAMLPWNLFSGGVQRAGNSLITDARLITKVYFPRELIPLASTAAVLLDLAVAGVVMILLMVLYHTAFTLTLLAILPLVLLALTITVGVSLFFSALNVYYRDFAYALPFLLQIWLYASPVVYSSSLVPERWRVVFALNPMAGVIDGFRWAFLGGPCPLGSLAEATIIGALMLLVGAYVFERVERSFADVI
ncbi:MAG: ABC transporter permease [Candidatus Limnocylindrales bacterium]